MKIYLLNSVVTGIVLTKLLCKSLKIEGIISVKREYADFISEYYDYEHICERQNIRYITTETYSLKSDIDREKLLALDIDIIIIVGWQRIIPEWLIAHCNIGVIGIHGSAIGISGGRGRSPQNWALICGENQFYISIFWVDSNIDSGEVIDTKEIKYELIDDINISYHKISLCLAEMIIESLRNGKLENHYGIKQEGEIGYLPKRIASDGMIDWRRRCHEIYNFVRALTIPYPCAYTVIDNHIIKIVRCKYIELKSSLIDHYTSGEVIMILDSKSFWVKCIDGIIEVLEYINTDGVEIKEEQIFESCNFKEQIRMIIERHKEEIRGPISPMILRYIQEDKA